MLKRIHLRNFKCFKSLSLNLAPLTLLTGFNAAGKSTTIQSFLLLSQFLRLREGATKLPLSGTLVNLGTAGEILNKTTNTKELMFDLETDDVSINWNFAMEKENAENFLKLSNEKLNTSDDESKVQILKETISNLIYIGAIRLRNTEFYRSPYEPDPVNANVGAEGEFAAWWFNKLLDSDINLSRLHPNEKSKILRKQYDAWAGEIFPDIEGNAYNVEQTDLILLQFRIGKESDWLRPSNIGYGITYSFPILVAGLLANKNQLLIIDSPESHLHPSGQSRMGRFLAHVAASGVQVIVETHSDHFLNGVRTAVLDQSIKHDDVAIHFFNQPKDCLEKNIPRVVSPLVDKSGTLDHWPDGFFDQSEKDLARLAGWL